ncbi:MAG: hypothetical protein QW620_07735 [Thermoplasmata archaeon]
MKLKKIVTIVILFILIFYGLFFVFLGAVDTRYQNLPYPPLIGLKIYGAADSAWEKFPGNGTMDNPKIIENFVILEKERYVGFGVSPSVFYDPIEIMNVGFHFIIRNCVIYVHGYSSAGFYLKNCPNCRIENCTFQGGMVQLDHATVVNCTFYCPSPCVEFVNCPKVSDNTFILMEFGDGGHIYYGSVRVGEGNAIYRNNFYIGKEWNNTGGMISAISEGPHYINCSGIGNYWSCWTQPDTNKDGVVDVPYSPPGASEYIMDFYPAAKPFPLTQREKININLDENGVMRTTRTTMLCVGVVLISIGAIIGIEIVWRSIRKKVH